MFLDPTHKIRGQARARSHEHERGEANICACVNAQRQATIWATRRHEQTHTCKLRTLEMHEVKG